MSDGMNEIIAGIYGTGGFEKTASIGETEIKTLADLAYIMAVDDAGSDLEKVASLQRQYLDEAIQADRAGRACAQEEISFMEKEAAEGRPEYLEAFWAEILD